jgi:hypothetical protein
MYSKDLFTNIKCGNENYKNSILEIQYLLVYNKAAKFFIRSRIASKFFRFLKKNIFHQTTSKRRQKFARNLRLKNKFGNFILKGSQRARDRLEPILCNRVARWFVFRPKIQIFGKFWMGLAMENLGRYIFRPFGLFY